ncbi:MAG: DUF427 domain-containing protein [Acidobacteriota bacterium]|nr:DUF427 domain-containing protein [Acidobacteriota bacterium]MDH3530859.1 DUF427 domain-containing protein [Acidobacteriota bacterium]
MTKKQMIVPPGPGQESVWDYPRPPRLEDSNRRIEIKAEGIFIVKSVRAKRVLETSHPPVFYFPRDDIRMEFLKPGFGSTFCEWKGMASYLDLEIGDRRIERAAWYYPEPTEAFRGIKDYVAFYPSKMDSCTVDGEVIKAQPGDFYGGWITRDIVGPFKGGPGTGFW